MKFLTRILLLFILFPCTTKGDSSLTEGGLIRDAEIEDVLTSYTIPLFEAAKLDPDSLQLFIVNSNEVNAMAMGGGRLALNTGLITKATSAGQVIGVLAHETAHLAGNHVVRGGEAYEKALLKSLLGAIGGIAIGLAGSPEAGMGVLLGSQEIAKQGLLAFSRSQEGAADQGAAKYLDALGYSSQGMYDFMQLLRKDDLLSEEYLDPYAITHPLKRERLDFFKSHLENSPHRNKPVPADLEDKFKRIKVKISAFTLPPARTFDTFPPTDQSHLAHYARAIAHFQNSEVEKALVEVNILIQEYPKDPFYWDLKGQILFDSGKIPEAIDAYQKAVDLRPDIPLLRLALAHTLTESENSSHHDRAYKELQRVRNEEPENPFTHRLLAVCHGKKGNTGLAALSLAEMALEFEDLDMAQQQAERSLALLKEDKVNIIRAKEILAEVKRLKDLKSRWDF